MRIVAGEPQCAASDGMICIAACDASSPSIRPWPIPASLHLDPLGCGESMRPKYGNDGYDTPESWCRAACRALPGCTHDLSVIEAPPSPMRMPDRQPRPPPPREIGGESPCQGDADCSVLNGSSCCHCRTIEVQSRLHQRGRPPMCGCGDMGEKQRIAELLGGDSGPCGPMPPDAGLYRPVCRAGACVGILR
jgi:hypothetical protein